ncbi:MAG: tetratricopeptide repeat protein [Simkaniaceae bacterium]
MQAQFQEFVEKYSGRALKEFHKVIRSFVLFNLISLFVIASECVSLFYWINFNPKSLPLAINIALICLSLFTYFVLFTYFQAKKPEELKKIKKWFISSLEEDIHAEKGTSEYHLLLANSSYQFSSFLHKSEYHCYKFPFSLSSFNILLRKLSFFLHWHDCHIMKEMLLLESISEHGKLIKKEPTDLEAHASLANAYIALSRLYKLPEDASLKWRLKFFLSSSSREKFHAAAKRAIEELKILDAYSPKDPWVQAQLASCYHDLELTDEEIKAYESIIELYPEDRKILFRLGQLYFKQGINSKGLKIYDSLKKLDKNAAIEMIEHYDSFIFGKFSETGPTSI